MHNNSSQTVLYHVKCHSKGKQTIFSFFPVFLFNFINCSYLIESDYTSTKICLPLQISSYFLMFLNLELRSYSYIFEPWYHWQYQISKRRILCDEISKRICIGMLKKIMTWSINLSHDYTCSTELICIIYLNSFKWIMCKKSKRSRSNYMNQNEKGKLPLQA